MQAFGDLANLNPHVHVLATDGAFLTDASFVSLARCTKTNDTKEIQPMFYTY